ncbi:MAG: BrxA family protein, partial [Isosphaeraceae bacterium]|jgi:hypothetical protein
MHETAREARYQARLTETGLAVEDTIALCAAYSATKDWDEVRSKALKENLLGKGSRSRILKLIRAVERRVVHAAPPLDRPIAISRFLAADAKVPTAAKAQLLFLLAVLEDIALGDAFRTLILPGVAGTGSRLLSADDIRYFLNRAAETRSEVAKWTDETRSRWAQGLRLVLREAGFVGSANQNGSIDLRPPVVRDEVVALLAHALVPQHGNGVSRSREFAYTSQTLDCEAKEVTNARDSGKGQG